MPMSPEAPPAGVGRMHVGPLAGLSRRPEATREKQQRPSSQLGSTYSDTVMSMLRSTRLEALFGGRLDTISYGQVAALVGDPDAAEAADLEYKKIVHAKDESGKFEYCKDLVALGNAVGGAL